MKGKGDTSCCCCFVWSAVIGILVAQGCYMHIQNMHITILINESIERSECESVNQTDVVFGTLVDFAIERLGLAYYQPAHTSSIQNTTSTSSNTIARHDRERTKVVKWYRCCPPPLLVAPL